MDLKKSVEQKIPYFMSLHKSYIMTSLGPF